MHQLLEVVEREQDSQAGRWDSHMFLILLDGLFTGPLDGRK